MRTLIIAIALFSATAAAAEDCSGYATMISVGTDAEVGPTLGPKTILTHPDATNLSLECRAGEPANVAGSIKASDPKPFLRLITKAAAYGLAIPEKDLRPLVAECQVRGMRKLNDLVEASSARAKVTCFVSRGYEAFEISPRS